MSMTACAQAWPEPMPNRADSRHSRMVSLLKLALPLAALAILATMFLLPQAQAPLTDLPLTARLPPETPPQSVAQPPTDPGASLLSEGVEGATYSGTTPAGAPLSVQVARVVPRAGLTGLHDATEIDATLGRSAWGPVTLRAAQAVLDAPGGWALLRGAVQVATGDGHALHSEALNVALDGHEVASPGPVLVSGPGTRIEAGAMVLTPDSAVVVFKNGVRVLYAGQTTGDPP